MIRDIIDLFRDGWIGAILAVMLTACCGLLLWMTVMLCRVGIHRAINGPIESGVIVSKGHRASYWSPVIVGKMTSMIYHPEDWSVVVEGRRKKTNLLDQISVSVNRDYWERAKVGDPITLK